MNTGNGIYSNPPMKIRLQGNSIRYRLRQPEVSRFEQEGIVEEIVQLGPGSTQQLSFSLRLTDAENVTVVQEGNGICIGLPYRAAERWTSSDLVGLEAIVDLGNGTDLKVLVEKDFACLDRGEEDNAGAYANPAKNC